MNEKETRGAIAAGEAALEASIAMAAREPRATALFCDIDGTLTPIQPRPSETRVPASMLDLLKALRRHLGLLALVSGRGVADAQRLVGIEGAAYVGAHGLEVRAASGDTIVDPGVARFVTDIRAIAEIAARDLDDQRLGVVLEDKGIIVALHYHQATDPGATHHEILRRVVEPARARGLAVITGNGVIEIAPPLAVTKGTAIRQLMAAGQYSTAMTVGDDLTDVTGFKAVHMWGDLDGRRTACAIAVLGLETPAPVRDEADVLVAGPAGVAVALERLLRALEPRF